MKRLDELARRWQLSPVAVAQLDVFLAELEADEHAPTTVRARHEAVEVHVADALDGLSAPALRAAGTIADLGAGAGVPGLILAAALPESRVVLVESNGRKCAFMDRVAAAMGLDNVDVVPARAETWSEGLGTCDVVTARALAPLPVLVEYAAPLLAEGGTLVAWKGAPEATEEADGEAAARALGLSAAERLELSPRPGADRRSLYLYVKVRSTPNGYPRRPGIARKRPIVAST